MPNTYLIIVRPLSGAVARWEWAVYDDQSDVVKQRRRCFGTAEDKSTAKEAAEGFADLLATAESYQYTPNSGGDTA